jgi:hypothetical protein
MKLSIVTTIYRTAECIEPFHAQVVEAAAAIGAELETIFVNRIGEGHVVVSPVSGDLLSRARFGDRAAFSA